MFLGHPDPLVGGEDPGLRIIPFSHKSVED
jgi:hypothetical protein